MPLSALIPAPVRMNTRSAGAMATICKLYARRVTGVGEETCAGLFGKQIAPDEPKIGGALGQAPHVPGKPIRAVGNQDAAAIAFPGQAQLFGSLNAVEHGEFEPVFFNALRFGPSGNAGDQPGIRSE